VTEFARFSLYEGDDYQAASNLAYDTFRVGCDSFAWNPVQRPAFRRDGNRFELCPRLLRQAQSSRRRIVSERILSPRGESKASPNK